MNAKEKLRPLYEALDSKQAHDIELIDISRISPLADYFILASAGSKSQMDAMLDAVDECCAKNHMEHRRAEGSFLSGWMLVDMGDVILHLFSDDKRDFYNLSHIWRDGVFLKEQDI